MDHTHPSAISMEPIPNVPRLTELPRGTEGGSRETVPYRLASTATVAGYCFGIEILRKGATNHEGGSPLRRCTNE
jgi:hypothetical protein